VSPASVAALRASLVGDALLPGDPEYDPDAMLYYEGPARRPCLIVRCNTTSDVQIGLRYAIDKGLRLSVCSGGHNMMRWSVLDDAVALDLGRLNHIRVSPDAKEAHIGPGARSYEVVPALSLGHASMTNSGGYWNTAQGGFLLGGGHSITSRSTGIGVDNILAMEVVLADGRAVNVSEQADEHPDLFWGMRGGCGFAFGIVTSYRMRLHPECGGEGSCLAGSLRFPSADMARVAKAFIQYVPDADWRLGLETGIDPSGHVLVTGVFNGRAEDGWEALKPLMTIPNTTLLDNSFRKTGNYFEAWSHLETGFQQHQTHTRGETVSAFFKESLPPSTWERLVQGYQALGIDYNIGIYAMGGAWSAQAVDAMAYPHRKYRYNLDLDAMFTTESLVDVVHAWSQEAFDKLVRPNCEPDCEVYCNYPHRMDNYAKKYWGPNLPRLSLMKSRWDPHGVFTFAQSIPPAQNGTSGTGIYYITAGGVAVPDGADP